MEEVSHKIIVELIESKYWEHMELAKASNSINHNAITRALYGLIPDKLTPLDVEIIGLELPLSKKFTKARKQIVSEARRQGYNLIEDRIVNEYIQNRIY